MDPIDRFRRGFAYNAWANREILRSLEAAPPPGPTGAGVPPRAVEVMAHLVGAEWAWLRRLGPKSPDMTVWPNLSLEECDRQLRTLSATWKAYLDGLTPAALGRALSYVNFKGEHWTNTVGVILTHVFTHELRHQGQIQAMLRLLGRKAPNADWI